jgi:hypothetical protein
MYPTINGTLARWQGLKRMLAIPHKKAPVRTTGMEPESIEDREPNTSIIITVPRLF